MEWRDRKHSSDKGINEQIIMYDNLCKSKIYHHTYRYYYIHFTYEDNMKIKYIQLE